MEQVANERTILPGSQNVKPYRYPETPFEKIGFSLSGGGFRAASYGLGVLSLMNEIKLKDQDKNSTLLEKVRFISSASGGTITLSVYSVAIHKGISFEKFYHHLNQQLTGEDLLQEAVNILNSDSDWEQGGKARNLINAFAKAYHSLLFSLSDEENRNLGFIMGNPKNQDPPHIEEFCFNASDFYTGISFRFQGREEWSGSRGGSFGNNNIEINWKDKQNAIDTLKKIRIADILAASSCFPLGFEPIMYPRDFSYRDGPSIDDLKNAIQLNTYSWDETKSDDDNKKSPRALKEKEFSEAKKFGLMDGGICDNQGLYSMLEANKRKGEGEENGQEPYNRFDLMMVSDVTSFYMSPYSEPAIPVNKKWMLKTPDQYFKQLKGLAQKIPGWITLGLVISVLITALFLLPLLLEGVSVASIALAFVGIMPLSVILYVRNRYNRVLKGQPEIKKLFDQESLQELFKCFSPKNTFTNRIAYKVIGYLQGINTGVIVQMILSRGLSASTMIGDVFLKHIRRLIYGKLFDDLSYKYHRLDNPIYKLTYTNDKNRRNPSFDEQGVEPRALYDARRLLFQEEVKQSCLLTDDMKKVAEAAYNAGTTLWFETEQENSSLNVRKALIATGQFTTCYSLLGYSLSLKHSRYFQNLESGYQQRIDSMISQLKKLMVAFQTNPYHLYEQLERQS